MWLGKGREIIKPCYFTRNEEPYEKYLIVFTDIAANYAKQLLNDVELKEECTYVRRAFVGEYKGKKIYVLNPYFGAPASVSELEIAIARGGKEFLVVGEAGAIKEGIKIGDVILPTWALREEGTSYHYMSPEYIPKPSKKLFDALEKEVKHQIGRKRIKIFKRGIWTTDAPFRETEDKVRDYSSRGILGVEMEASALMSVASFRGVDLAVALAVSDELYKEKWNPGFGSRKLKRAEELLISISLKYLS